MAIPHSSPLKSQLRVTLRKFLRESETDPSHACEALHIWLLAHPDLFTVAAFSALPGEVNLSATIIRHPDIRWLYPRVEGRQLTFHPGGFLAPGAFDILEPPPGSPEVPLQEIDAFLCPGLAFDRNGGRLGRGRGYYDRTLANARPDAFKIGICHPFQIVGDTFPEAHDIPMDTVIS